MTNTSHDKEYKKHATIKFPQYWSVSSEFETDTRNSTYSAQKSSARFHYDSSQRLDLNNLASYKPENEQEIISTSFERK